MKHDLPTVLGLALAAAFALPALAQENLPFPPVHSASSAGLSMQDSVHHKRTEPQRLPQDAPNILIILIK